MVTNPVVMEGAGQTLERRSWQRSGNLDLFRVGKIEDSEERFDASIKAETGSVFDSVDQVSKGVIGRVATPEWQEEVDLAQGVQIADRSMQAIDEELQQAKNDLLKIRKMFPPYPHGSEEREALLNSYQSLRMQIDQLTFPPESDTAAQILGDEAGTENGEPGVGRFPVNSGAGGLELVELEKTVSELEDSELPALIEDLDRASGVLAERRQGLKESAGKVFGKKSGEEQLFAKMSDEVREQLANTSFSLGRSETGVHQDLPFL